MYKRQVFNVLLQVLDDGRMTDGQGRTVDFKNTVIIMTSNIGSHEIQRLSSDPKLNDVDLIKEAVLAEVRKAFRPEFINRLDEIVVFHGLDRQQIASIARIQLQSLARRLAERDLTLEVSESALAQVGKAGFDPVYGARPLKRAIQQEIENPIARRMLEGRYAPNDIVPVDYRDGKFTFEAGAASDDGDGSKGSSGGASGGSGKSRARTVAHEAVDGAVDTLARTGKTARRSES